MFRAIAFVILMSQCSFGQKAGSVEAYRQQYAGEMRNIENEADWNSAKKLCKFFDPVEKYKETTQDFSLIELPDPGVVGYMQKWRFKVVSIVDTKNAILSIEDVVLWLEDFDTSILSDGDSVAILDPVKFTPTKRYSAVSGASRTVKAIKMIDKPEMEKHKAKLAEDAAAKAREKRKMISQVFEYADGKSVEAVFIDIRKGKVILEGLDGETIERVLADFSTKSSANIRGLFKSKPKQAPAKKL